MTAAPTKTPPIIIAIDGPSASGKGTLGKKLAQHFDFAHLDTGLLYRAVALAVLRDGKDPTNPSVAERMAYALDPIQVMLKSNDQALRADSTSSAASRIAAMPEVRAALLKFQQNFCSYPPDGKKGVVLDGRDIGTVIAPHAQVKIYVTASLEARVSRRFAELRKRGEHVTEQAVRSDMKERDERDTSRAIAPAKPAPDAVLLDTSDLTQDEAFADALKIVQEKVNESL